MRHFNIDANIENIYKKTNSVVLVNNKTRTFFNTSVDVRQGCILSPTLFNIFLEKIMQDTLEDQCSTIAVRGYELCNLRFVDNIDLMAVSNTELQELINKLCKCSAKYCMEVSYEKSNNWSTNSRIMRQK